MDPDFLGRRPANHQPLTPLAFLERAAAAHPEALAAIHGDARMDYAALRADARRLASALAASGVRRGDVVSTLLFNTPPQLVAHYGVPMAGAVLNTLNTRLDAAGIAFILRHAEARALIVDAELGPLAREAAALAGVEPLIVEYVDPTAPAERAFPEAPLWEALLARGDPEAEWTPPADEWEAIALNYTSGTTGDPKGVLYHHRGAALMGYANALHGGLRPGSVYLWTLPMFHCNGWCFPWTLSLVAGVHVCLRQVRGPTVWAEMARHGVTHLCGAPIVMSTLLSVPEAERPALSARAAFLTAAAPPPEAVLAAMDEAGFDVTHVYGLTETYGPAVVNEWKPAWSALPPAERAAKKARQGIPYAPLRALAVLDPATLEPVPADGATLGEVMFRGDIVMKGYHRNPEATEKALGDGWFRSGDLGVMHPDGYVQLKDRSKDIIISGGENISSIEVEDALWKHPAVAGVAVVARPDETWGESPCAFVELREGREADEAELIAWCRERLARFKAPRTVVFGELPKTSTGKVQKYQLRERARKL
jgi:fatty-acyl-CoA synthase